MPLLLDVGPHRLGDREAARLAADARDLREGGRLRHRLEEAHPLLLHGRRALLASRALLLALRGVLHAVAARVPELLRLLLLGLLGLLRLGLLRRLLRRLLLRRRRLRA